MGRAVAIIGTLAIMGFASWVDSVTMALLDSIAIFPVKSSKCVTCLKNNFYKVFPRKTSGVW